MAQKKIRQNRILAEKENIISLTTKQQQKTEVEEKLETHLI